MMEAPASTREIDAFAVANSIMGVNRTVNQVRGTIDSLDIEWRTSGTPVQQCTNQPVNRMSGNFVEGIARIAVTATTPRTDVRALSNGLGHEQNGSFYSASAAACSTV